MKLVKLLANLGYGSRKEVQAMIRSVMVRDDSGKLLTDKDDVAYESVRFRGEPLDPLGPLVLALNKPDGFTCSTEDPGDTIYDLLPERFAYRKPGINPVGRLDKDTTGLLLLTDNGQLLHKIIHPKNGCLKVYHTILDRPLEGHEAE
ncbi:MAG: pseudouridine synthase, partial [Verrucomicrobiales bacterium]